MGVPRGYSANLSSRAEPLRPSRGDTRATSPPRGNREPGHRGSQRTVRSEARAEGVRPGPPGGSGLPRGFANNREEASMQIMPSRRDFLASAVAGRRRGRAWRPGIARRRGAAGDDDDRLADYRNICLSPPVDRQGFAARRRVHRHPLRDRSLHHPAVARGDSHFGRLRRNGRLSHRQRRAHHGLSGLHSGCYELFAHEPTFAPSLSCGARGSPSRT